MSGLRAFATKLPGMSDQSRPQSTLYNDRVQAKMQELGFSGALTQPHLRRQLVGDQQRVAVPRVRLQSLPSGPSNTHKRWQALKSNAMSPENANEEEFEHRSVEEANDHRDLFDTDLENLDSTVTLSDDDAQALRARMPPDKAIINSLNQAYEQGNSRGESFPFDIEDSQHQEGDRSEKNDLTMTEDDYAIDSIENGSNDEDVLEREDLRVQELMPQGLVQEFKNANYNHLGSYEPPLIREAKAGSFLASPTIHKNLVMRNANEPSPDLAIPISTKHQLDTDYTIGATHSVDSMQHHHLKHDLKELVSLGGSNGNPGRSERNKPNENQVPTKQFLKRQDQRQRPVVVKGQSPSQERSEPSRTTARALVPTGPPVSAYSSTSKGQITENVSPSSGIKGLIPREKESDAFRTPIHKHAIELDYNPTELRQMTYQRLSHEAFDCIPQTPMIKQAQGEANLGLSEMLQHVYDLRGGADLHLQRQTIFSDLKIDQYEECGILLAEKISGIMARYKAVRQQKRMVAMGFEAEVANRAECVLAKEQAINQDLERLKKAGENVVRG